MGPIDLSTNSHMTKEDRGIFMWKGTTVGKTRDIRNNDFITRDISNVDFINISDDRKYKSRARQHMFKTRHLNEKKNCSDVNNAVIAIL